MTHNHISHCSKKLSKVLTVIVGFFQSAYCDNSIIQKIISATLQPLETLKLDDGMAV